MPIIQKKHHDARADADEDPVHGRSGRGGRRTHGSAGRGFRSRRGTVQGGRGHILHLHDPRRWRWPTKHLRGAKGTGRCDGRLQRGNSQEDTARRESCVTGGDGGRPAGTPAGATAGAFAGTPTGSSRRGTHRALAGATAGALCRSNRRDSRRRDRPDSPLGPPRRPYGTFCRRS